MFLEQLLLLPNMDALCMNRVRWSHGLFDIFLFVSHFDIFQSVGNAYDY